MWKKRIVRFERYDVPSSRGTVRIELADGSIGIQGPGGELFYDGWATVEDIAQTLTARIHLGDAEARSVAAAAVDEWELSLGDRPHRYPRRSD